MNIVLAPLTVYILMKWMAYGLLLHMTGLLLERIWNDCYLFAYSWPAAQLVCPLHACMAGFHLAFI